MSISLRNHMCSVYFHLLFEQHCGNSLLIEKKKRKILNLPDFISYGNILRIMQGLFQQFIACDNHMQSPALFRNISKFFTFLPKFSYICPFCPFYPLFPFSEKLHAFPYFLEYAFSYKTEIGDSLKQVESQKSRLQKLARKSKTSFEQHIRRKCGMHHKHKTRQTTEEVKKI